MPFKRTNSPSAPVSRKSKITYARNPVRPSFSVSAISTYFMIWFWHEKAPKSTAQKERLNPFDAVISSDDEEGYGRFSGKGRSFKGSCPNIWCEVRFAYIKCSATSLAKDSVGFS